MKTLQHSGKGLLVGMLVAACAALPVVQPLAAHATSPTAIISATMQGRSTIDVMGRDFLPGSTVLVQFKGSTFVAYRKTTASRILPPVPPVPPCTPEPGCRYLPILGGTISTELRHSLSQPETVTVSARDLANGARSNAVTVTLGA
jgi:hypothetical protein